MTDYTHTLSCLPKVQTSWQQFCNYFTFKHPIHPLDPIAPENSEFFLIDSRIRIRIIHLKPESAQKYKSHHDYPYSKRSSLSEEYWFTKWNKPLKIGVCNCSFRRSLRLDILTNQSLRTPIENKRESLMNFDMKPTKIFNLETFVERIIQETCFEAFHEYYMIQKDQKFKCNVNLSYGTDDDVILPDKPTNCVTNQPKILEKKHNCLHNKKKTQTKPIIILFHGIGSSADVWGLIVNTLINKGFEVIAPDMLGHGYSSAPDKANYYTFHSLLIHAITIFDHYVDDKKKCILIGHSYGCSIASALYRHRAAQITQLILLSGGGPTPLAAPVNNHEMSPFGCIHTLFQPFIFCGLKRSFLFSSRGKHFYVCHPDTAIPKHILEYVSQGQNWPEGDATFHRRILVPTLLVHGLQDTKVTLVQQCEMERTIPRAFLELIPNSGHMTMLETPEHLTHMILCFIDTWS